MATHSGKSGVISYNGTEVSTIGEWTWNEDAANSEAVASNTGGAVIQTPGVKDSQGTFAAFGKNPPLFPGVASATLIGDTGYGKVTGTAFIAGAKVSIDLETFKTLEWSVDFEGSGSLTYASTSSVTPAAAPLMYAPIGGKATWQPVNAGSLGSAADLPTVQKIDLAFSCPVQPYTPNGATSRSKLYGVPIKCTGSLTLADDALAAISTGATNYRPGDIGILKCYVSATEYFNIKYAMIKSVGVAVDPKTGKATMQTVNFDWTAWGMLTAGLDRGTLVAPDGTVLWS